MNTNARTQERRNATAVERIQGHLAHKTTPTPLGPPYDPGHGPTVGSYGAAVSYERGTPVWRS